MRAAAGRPSTGAAFLGAVFLAAVLAGCAPSERETRYLAEKTMWERRNQGLRELVQRAGEGPLVKPDLFVVGVGESLIVELMSAQLPYEHALSEKLIARVDSGSIDLEDKYGVVTLTGSVLRAKDRARVALLRLQGGLGEVHVDSSAQLHVGVAIDDVQVLHAGGFEGILRPSDKRWIAEKGKAKLQEELPDLKIPVSLSRAIPIPPIHSDVIQLDSLLVPIEISVSEVLAVGGKLWVLLRADVGEVQGSEEGVDVRIRKKKKGKTRAATAVDTATPRGGT